MAFKILVRSRICEFLICILKNPGAKLARLINVLFVCSLKEYIYIGSIYNMHDLFQLYLNSLSLFIQSLLFSSSPETQNHSIRDYIILTNS